MFLTIAYKTGFIHFSYINQTAKIEVQFSDYTIKEVKSEQSAKNQITRKERKRWNKRK